MLRHFALLEIRSMAVRRRPLSIWPDDDYVACIHWMADICDNMPFTPDRERSWWRRQQPERRFAYAWEVAGPLGRTWILKTLARHGLPWIPPETADATNPMPRQ